MARKLTHLKLYSQSLRGLSWADKQTGLRDLVCPLRLPIMLLNTQARHIKRDHHSTHFPTYYATCMRIKQQSAALLILGLLPPEPYVMFIDPNYLITLRYKSSGTWGKCVISEVRTSISYIFSCPAVKEQIRRYSSHYGDRLRNHPNHLAVNLLD
jgi:hypothetical protein